MSYHELFPRTAPADSYPEHTVFEARESAFVMQNRGCQKAFSPSADSPHAVARRFRTPRIDETFDDLVICGSSNVGAWNFRRFATNSQLCIRCRGGDGWVDRQDHERRLDVLQLIFQILPRLVKHLLVTKITEKLPAATCWGAGSSSYVSHNLEISLKIREHLLYGFEGVPLLTDLNHTPRYGYAVLACLENVVPKVTGCSDNFDETLCRVQH